MYAEWRTSFCQLIVYFYLVSQGQCSCLGLNLNYTGCCVSSLSPSCSNNGCYCDRICYQLEDCCNDTADIGCHPNITISSVSLTKSPSSVPIAGTIATYTFNCSVSVQCTKLYCGMDTVNIDWFFNNVTITDMSSLVTITTGSTSVNGNNTVHSILTTEDSISTSHAGIYQCRANLISNTTVVVMSNPVTLNVQIINATVTPTVVIRLNTPPYDIFSLNCVIGIVPPTYNTESVIFSWPQEDIYGVGNVMNNGLESNLTVDITDGISSGTFTFTCNANVTITGAIGTAMATDSATVTIKGPAVPVQPVLGPVIVTPTTATIHWTIPQVSYTPENYTVLIGLSMNELNMTSSVVNTNNIDNLQFITSTDVSYNVTIQGLSINIMYYYQVKSINTISKTNSIISSFTTSESAPTKPTNVKLTSLNSTSLYLSWEPPSQPNGVIIDYNYTCSDDNATISYYSSDMMTYSSLLRNATLTGLEPFRQYTCNVTAATAVGIGPPAIVSNVTGQAAPSGPPLFITVTSSQPNVIILSWTPPDISLQNGIIISYTYYCTELGESNKVDKGTVTSTTVVITNTMIKTYTNYICFVSATTSAGSGPNGNATGRTAEDVPSEVVSLRVSSLSDTSLNISWSQPASPNGIITSYIVILTYYTNDTIASSSTVNGTMLHVIIGGLAKYIPYNISVSAATSAGNGPEVTLTAFTKEGAPPAIKVLNATYINDTAIYVTWDPLVLINGFIGNYTIILIRPEYSLMKIVPSNYTSVVFINLQSNVAYAVMIYASTTGGEKGEPNITIVDPLQSTLSTEIISDKNYESIAILGAMLAVVITILVIICVLFCLFMRQCPPRGKSKEGTSSVYDAPDNKSNIPTDTSCIEMLSYKEHDITLQESHIYDVPVATTTKVVTVQESVVYDLPVATTTSGVIKLQDNSAYTVFKK